MKTTFSVLGHRSLLAWLCLLVAILIFLCHFGFSVQAAPVSDPNNERGKYFSKKVYAGTPIAQFAASKNLLPSPVLEGNPDWVAMYWKCWELAYHNFKKPVAGSPLVSDYLDEGFNPSIFQWDTIFMMMYARYGQHVFPAIQSLDNFYALQRNSGFICREYLEADGAAVHFDFTTGSDGNFFANKGWRNTVNPPLFSWAEFESYRVTGDRSRFAMILPVLEKYAEWLNRDGDPEAADWEANGRISKSAAHKLYWNTPLGSGMDNTPRPTTKGAGWVEMSAQMVIMYNQLASICDELGQTDKAGVYRGESEAIGKRINQFCWNEADGFYYDVQADGTQFRKKTSGGFWPLLAGIATKAQAEKLVGHLKNEKEFWRQNVFPTLAADENEYDPSGRYWQGGVWAPTDLMIIKGLELYGYEDFATEATEKYLKGMAAVFKQTGTVWELYAPDLERPGSGSQGLTGKHQARPDFVGWSGCGPISLLIENVIGLRPDAIHNRMVWHLHRTDRHGIEHLRVGPATLTFLCKKRESPGAAATVTLESDQAFEVKIVHPKGTTNVVLEPGKIHKLTVGAN